MSSLFVTQGLHLGRRFSLRERTRIGRALDNEIVLTDHLVSRYHAEVLRRGPHFFVHDLGSKNGLQLNEAIVTEQRLQRGDLLQVGKTIFRFETPKESRSARFSNTVVHLDSAPDEGIKIFDRAALPVPARNEATDFLLRLGRVFECDADELPEALNATLGQLIELFGAAAGSILLRLRSGEATPLVATAEGLELHLGHEALQVVLGEGKAVLTAALTAPPAGAAEGSDVVLRRHPAHALFVPLMRRESVFGALHLERTGAGNSSGAEFTAEDLGLLQALARLISGAVHYTVQTDQIMLAASTPDQVSFVGASEQAEAIRDQIQRVAASDSTVMLTGETGTGKELVSRAIHAASPRAHRPFVAIDCSAIPASLMESELFGYEAGAFTGADRLKRGKVEMAEGGTLFLDEVGEMLIDLQPKLLRFIEELTFYRVGGLRPIPADVRIIAATNRNLIQAVNEGRFRQDLLFRLNVMPIVLAPLRDRVEDIRPLVEHFTPRLAARLGKPFLGLVDEAWTLLEHYPWPGNVRELRHSLERALILSDDGILRPEHFQIAMPEPSLELNTDGSRTQTIEQTSPADLAPARAADLPPSMAAVEAQAIRRALRYAGGNRVRAAEILQIHRNTLAKKIQEYGIDL